MRLDLIPGAPVDVTALSLLHEEVQPGSVASGVPTTATHALGSFGDLALGVWEMSAGGMHDVEAEELFIVLAGRATVEIHGDDRGAGIVALSPGTLMRLGAGMRTTWTVQERLRKVYLSP
ncbi:cupin domain-containing protein [Arthrobacter sp.]|uniref:cupin domain-containing protein n=1 Tax=Arthrobacter sp. TaxID=1667 RepID=UPI0033987E1F